MEKYIRDAIILWATIDPISTLLVFVAITPNHTQVERNRVALKATFLAMLVLLTSIVVGQVLLSAMGITMLAFQIAGGIILFLFAIRLVFANLLDPAWTSPSAGKDIAIFPLAIPTIATPGAILAVIILTDNHLFPLPVQLGTTAITLIILALTYGAMRFASGVLRLIGSDGAELIVRVMGLILAALSVQLVFDAIRTSPPPV